MTNKTLYLHIGLAKTGTTSIQEACAIGESWLLEHDVLYPKSGRSTKGQVDRAHHDIAIGGNAHRGVPHAELPHWMELSQNRYSDNISQLSHEIARSSVSKVVISSEHFSWIQDINSINMFKAAMSEHFQTFKAVLFLRPWDEWAMSVANQHIKEERINKDCKGSFFRIFDNLYGIFESLIAFKDCFGKENIIIKYFGKDLLNGFLDAIDIGIERQGFVLPHYNSSLSPGLLALRFRMNRAFQDKYFEAASSNAAYSDTAFFVDRLQPIFQKITEDKLSTRPIFTPQQRIDIYKRCNELGGDLFYELLGRREVFPDPNLSSDENWQSPEELDSKGLLDVIAALVLDYVDCRESVDSLLRESHFLSEKVKHIERSFFRRVLQSQRINRVYNLPRRLLRRVFKST